jgi:hypothetical protein
MGLWKLRVQCLKKNSGFAANFAEKLAWRPHHVLEPADKSAWFPTHGRFKWDVPWRLEETFDTARTSHDVQHKNQQHVPFQKKTCLISIKSLNFMSSASQDFWERAGGNPEQIHRLSCEFQKTWAVATGPLAQSVLSGRSNARVIILRS